MSYEERPPLRIVISDPKAGDKVVKVKVVGAEDIELKNTMIKSKDKERTELPIARINEKLADELGLKEVGVLTLRFRGEEGKRTNISFKVEINNDVPENTVQVSMELLGEVAGDLEAEAEAFRAKAWQIAVPEDVAIKLAGLQIGETFDGSLIGMEGLRFKIRGGSDASGFPMHPGVPGSGKKKVLLSGPPGYRPRRKGERKRKTVRGRVIPDPRGERRKTALAQLNVVIYYEKES
ncbi:MAG: 30S ribosomal protein S6e [Desulfurococcales archaeon]|nr:30S ribosomal protein S6e [Desulfurococcales archaeon]MEB3789726.1 30S ribosomal protein S6e [Desulfurococcales archaeon]